MKSLQNIIIDFIDESLNLSDHIMADIAEMETFYDTEIINRIYRGFHSIKGDAHILGFDQISAYAHKAENLLSSIRDQSIEIEKSSIDQLLYNLDMIRTKLENIRKSDIQYVDISISENEGVLFQPIHNESKNKEIVLDLIDTSEKPKTSQLTFQIPSSFVEGLKILIVEDDFSSRTILLDFLSKYGHCHVANDGLEAIQAFTSTYEETPPAPYDLICMDILMPKMDGTRACKTIREIERGKGVEGTEDESTIIVITSLADPSTYVKTCYECGADAYLVKPIDLNQLKRHISGLQPNLKA